MLRSSKLLAIMFAGLITLAAAGTCLAADAKAITPEGAVTAYVDGVARQDFKAIIAATVAEDLSKKFDFVFWVDRNEALTYLTPAPATDPLFVEINKANFVSKIAGQVKFLAYGLMSTRDILTGNTVKMAPGEATEFMSAVRANRLDGLELIKIGIPKPRQLNSERYQAIKARNARQNGADGSTERVALLSFEGLYFSIGFDLLRYGERWAVESQYSRIADFNSIGGPLRTTPEEFDELLK